MDRDARIARVLRYHERTMHRYPGGYARSLGHLDWATQPDPFRAYEGAPIVLLDEIAVGAGHEATWSAVRDATITPAPVDARTIAQLFYDALAISAWKQAGRSRWALRCNPSSGNLHPTEAYLLCDAFDGPGLFHYAPRMHGLERRRDLDVEAWRALAPDGGMIVGLASIAWREAWKYGERAFRYCMHDVGHAIGALAIAARPLGWSVRVIEGVDDARIARLLGLEESRGVESERPDVLLAIDPQGSRGALDVAWSDDVVGTACAGVLRGVANRLSSNHQRWDVIDDVEDASREDGAGEAHPAPPALVRSNHDGPSPSARLLARRRRSAVEMDGVTSISRDAFFRTMRSLVPALTPALHPLPWAPEVHPVVFVHRVEGLEPGLAILVRDPAAEPFLRSRIALADEWVRLPGAPDDLPLYGIAQGDARTIARALTCHQDIAADGAFAVAMLARFAPVLRARGPSWYRRLHWEAGHVGQLLYLEAEAHDVAATGIGCFFDDGIHELLGIESDDLRALYCFTVGGAVNDPRIQTQPAYSERG
ncbi:nitroreductase family protein [Sandaracinus amylolyticus]|uniref:Nitroreductase domain-containing protein n=1 Tax=Sandaracinus amylolyticus TaxID=927083 RepID=A0A0F6VZX3_9BACT|nr:nitroreductase family protein [Sandaracinus amylolyticus]AKF03905.1 Hypothetical protein DB32_001054 [Sandaracinus amylolyticus]